LKIASNLNSFFILLISILGSLIFTALFEFKTLQLVIFLISEVILLKDTLLPEATLYMFFFPLFIINKIKLIASSILK
jgi:hypothetical protein